MIPYERSENANTIYAARYLDAEAKTVEDLHRRVSGGNPDYFTLMNKGYGLPNSPTLFNLGTKNGGTSSACFTSDTVIHTLAGDFTVSELLELDQQEFEVFSCNGKRLKIGRAFGLKQTKKNAKVYRVKFDTGDKIKLTADHLVMLRNGTYKEVRYLKKGDSVMPFNFSYQKDGNKVRRKICPKISDEKVYCHRWVWEKIHGRKPAYGHDIHHRNDNSVDDSSENLQEMTHGAHASLHMQGNQKGIGPKPGTAKAMIGNQHALRTDPHPNPIRQRQRLWARAKSRRETAERRGRHNHEVVSVKFIGRQDVYDLSVHKYHNFAANGIFIHNCFVFDIDDCLLGDWPNGGFDSPFPRSICGTTFKAMAVAKAGGGVGYYLGNIRRKNAEVKSTHKRACGPVIALRWLNQIDKLITQGGKRALAQMGILPCWHADILEFIHCKDVNPHELSSFNISVSWTDEWLEKVNFEGTNFTDDQGIESTIWWEQCHSAWKSGCPGMFFWNTMNRFNATPHLGNINATNPCGETPNLSDEPCNLASMAIIRFFKKVKNNWVFMWDEYKYWVRVMIRFMDDILDRNIFPHPDITKMALDTRKLGMGVMGYADALALLNIPYDSQDAVDWGEQLAKVNESVTLDESIELAISKGVYPAWKTGTEENQKKYPAVRNSTRTSIAPTGTINLLADASASIEPHYDLKWERTTGEGIKLKEEIQIAKHLNGFVPKTAHEISPQWHIRHQAAWQRHTDLGVSKTINMPETATVRDVSNAYHMMWETGCKGGTIFRNNCRPEQVLRGESKPVSVYLKEGVSHQPSGRKKLPKRRQGDTEKFSIGGTEGYLTLNVYEDGTLGEIFVELAHDGATLSGFVKAFCKTFSVAIQQGTPLETLISLHRSATYEPRGMTGDPEVPTCTSITDYIVQKIEKRFAKKDVTGQQFWTGKLPGEVFQTGQFCPECSTELTREAGCMKCLKPGCGFSKC